MRIIHSFSFFFYYNYSGLMYTDNYAVRRLPEIVTTSGYALIHFYSDIAYNMSGFNISYRYKILFNPNINYNLKHI